MKHKFSRCFLNRKNYQKYCTAKKCFWGIVIPKTWHCAKCTLLWNVLPEKRGKWGEKKEENSIFYTTTASRWFDCRNRFLVLNIISVISNEKEGLTLASQPPQSLPKIQEYCPTRVWQFGQYNLPERFCRISGSIHFTGLINTEAAKKK
jgi:hypothetical protein